MIVFIGDIHGEFYVLEHLLAKLPEDIPVVQVGDFGVWPRKRNEWPNLGRAIYFIDGNHDHIPSLPIHGTEPVEVWPGAIYVPRGLVLELAGKRVLFCGGSKSVDRAWRVKDSEKHGWFEEEQLSAADVERAIGHVKPIDLMVTHTPPDEVIRRNFSPDGLRHFGHDPDVWVDESARAIEFIWKQYDKPQLVCGHMHQSVTDGPVRILDINEAWNI